MPNKRNSFKYKIWRIVVSTPFEYLIMMLIVFNTLLLMMKVCDELCFYRCVEGRSYFDVAHLHTLLQQFFSSLILHSRIAYFVFDNTMYMKKFKQLLVILNKVCKCSIFVYQLVKCQFYPKSRQWDVPSTESTHSTDITNYLSCTYHNLETQQSHYRTGPLCTDLLVRQLQCTCTHRSCRRTNAASCL